MELNYNFFSRLPAQYSFVFTEIENIARLSKKLEISFDFGRICNS